MNISKMFSVNQDSSQYLNTIRQSPRRLLIGIGIMLISSVVGGLLLSKDTQTFTAFAVTRDVAAGVAIGTDEVDEVQLPVAASRDQWLSAADVEGGFITKRPLEAGVLLQRGDVSDFVEPGDQIGISVETGYLPAGLSAGQVVALWAVDPQLESGFLAEAVVLAFESDENSKATFLSLRIDTESTAVVLQQATLGTLRVVIHT